MEIKQEKESEGEKERTGFKMRELSDYTMAELRVILKHRKLPTTGLKEDLIRRLQADQQYPSQVIKKSNAVVNEKERKKAMDVVKAIEMAAIRYSTNMSIIQREAELYRREAELNWKEKELTERELALTQKELKNIQQVQVNTDARTQERSRNLHKPLKDQRSGGAVLVSRRDDGTKQRTKCDRSERERDQPKTLRPRGQRDHSEANCQTKYKDADNKYYFKYSERERVASEWYKNNEERRNTRAREKPESGRPGPCRRTIQIETPARYCGQRGFHFPNVKYFKYSERGHVASEWYKKNEERRNTYAREMPESGRPGPFRRTIQIETPARYCGQRGFHFSNVK